MRQTLPTWGVAALFPILAVVAVGFVHVDASLAQSCSAVPDSGVIDKPGHYCLRRNLVVDRAVAVDISAPDVTLDLAKFKIAKRARLENQVSFGVRIRSTAHDVAVRNGHVRGFSIGVHNQGLAHVAIEELEISADAIGIHSEGSAAVIRRNHIIGVVGAPLDAKQAYAIGVNVAGNGVQVEGNVLEKIHRQDKPRAVDGEAVGILVRYDCANCTISNNRLVNDREDIGSIGIWNAALGRTDIVGNTITLFDHGAVSAGRIVSIRDNRITCGSNYKRSGGIALSLDYSRTPGAFAITADNSLRTCTVKMLVAQDGTSLDIARELKKGASERDWYRLFRGPRLH